MIADTQTFVKFFFAEWLDNDFAIAQIMPDNRAREALCKLQP